MANYQRIISNLVYTANCEFGYIAVNITRVYRGDRTVCIKTPTQSHLFRNLTYKNILFNRLANIILPESPNSSITIVTLIQYLPLPVFKDFI